MNKEAARHNLLEIKNILDKLHIKFWLAHGTLLGAIREKGFIAYDFDLDGAILATNWSPSLCGKFMKHGFACSTRKAQPKRPAQLRIVKRGITTHVGLKYYYPPENIYFSLPNVPTVRNATLPAKLLKGDYFVHFLGTKFRVPNPPQEYLGWLYGKNWRTPVNDLSWQKAWKKISLDKYLKWLDEHPIPQHREPK